MNEQQTERVLRATMVRDRVSRAVWVALLMILTTAVVSCRRSAPAPAPAQVEARPAPTPPPPAPAITLTASQSAITTGSSVTLEWQAQNANAVEITPGVGMVATSGSRAVSPTSSVTYSARATGPGGTATATVRITVNTPVARAADPPPAPSIDELFRTSVVPVYFDYDKSDIRADQVTRLQTTARFLQQNGGVQFTISGHADERGSQEYNIGLGDRRANAVRQYLIGQGIAASRMNTVSYGEERPVCNVSAESCWSQNRRAEYAMR